ncbi:MAG: efflux RND transporter periplasmic adaptor subunit [Acidobacteria bacterium]|nr:efflux RND transporter periplasmic adaptor subunit [Acidobacteriota bacterium]
MDREIDSKIRHLRIFKRIGLIVGLALVVSAGLIWGPAWLRPSVHRSKIRTARVDWGAIESGISASGTVVPEFEAVLSSPIDARVIRVLKQAGSTLSIGDPIIELDTSSSQLELERINQNLELKQNQQAKTRLEFEEKLNDLQSRMEIKRLELQSHSARLNQSRTLFRDGLISADDVRRAELEEAKARTELSQLESSRQNAEQTTDSQIKGLAMEMAILHKEKSAAASELNLATTKSNRNGVLTWVVPEEGSTVRKGEVIARIADLHSFRVDAAISDVHAGDIRIGMPVEVKVNEESRLTGNITNILPTIKDGILTMQIGLEDKTSKILRSNLRVDVHIITERRDCVLRIKKGPALTGQGANEVFVIRGAAAIKTPVRLGLASFDAFEVVSGLMEGDEVIISDVSDYLHLKEFEVK